jgi:hypothetical protein
MAFELLSCCGRIRYCTQFAKKCRWYTIESSVIHGILCMILKLIVADMVCGNGTSKTYSTVPAIYTKE